MNWSSASLDELCEINVGRTPARANPEFWGTGEPWLSIADMNQGRLITSTKEQITPLAARSGRVVAPGTVLLSFKLSIGKVARAGIPLFTNEAIAALPIKRPDILLPEFLARALEAKDLAGGSNRAAMGATLNKAKLKQIQIPLPPIDDQRHIAAILDRADALRALRRQALTGVEDLSQAIFHDMFGDPTVMGVWPLRTVADIAADQKHALVDGPFGSSLKPSDYRDEGVPVIRIKNISRDGELVPEDLLFISFAKFATLRRSSLQAGDVLVSRVGTLGNTCVFPSDFGDALLSTTGVCKITTNRSVMLPQFLHAAIRTTSFQRQIENSASTSVQKYFNLSALRAWRIIAPPIEEQWHFVHRLDAVTAHRARLRHELAVTESLQASLQHNAFAAAL